jgi:hypothetical protein
VKNAMAKELMKSYVLEVRLYGSERAVKSAMMVKDNWAEFLQLNSKFKGASTGTTLQSLSKSHHKQI